jgi:sialidase-1
MKSFNPVMKLDLSNKGSEEYTINSITVSLDGTSNLNDIESVGVYQSNDKGLIDGDNLIYLTSDIKEKINLPIEYDVCQDSLSLWLSLRVKDSVDLLNRYAVTLAKVETSDGIIPLKGHLPNKKKLRAGVAVRQHNQDNIHTSRIPGLATSKKGTLLAIYDARYDKEGDLQGNIDIAMNRSFDGGRTWKPTQIVLDMGEWGGLPEKYNGVSDACVLVDENSGDIYVAGLWMHGVLDNETGKWVPNLTADSTRWMHQWQGKGSQPGFGEKETSQFLITKSTDDGETWSKPTNITHKKQREWWLYAPAPGHGITLEDGTLVFPTQGRDKDGKPFSNITWSKDGGRNWNVSSPAYSDVTECMAVQLSDNSIMLNMRDNRNRGDSRTNGRRICVTKDLGKTWEEHPTSRKALVEPTCMASIHKHKYTKKGKEKSILLFANPESFDTRDHITLKVSYDDGDTWQNDKKILLDELKGRGYSCITSVDEQTIGILYESSQSDLVFQQIDINELLPD